ncbi:hypothetical protein Dsin_032259 [Dipteronia sinensis]|uniref:Transposase MuDR plant domain-containing protein n=1 Tax=Dipteronia sinensis TaxID=43782 RepID=A0AAD9ZMR4_9ROSI|nr:hypothetical protein Dsin_032259 [Dipteronia sinensis]
MCGHKIPWSGDKYGAGNDNELLELFSRFEKRGLDRIVFELEDYYYVPTLPEEPPVLDVEGRYEPLGWYDMEAEQLNYEGDSEQDDDKDNEADEDCERDNTQYNEVSIVDEESVKGDGGITQECMDDFKGYQSNDQYFTDSDLEPNQVRIAKLVKGQPFKRMMDGVIGFHIGQIFNSKEHMGEIFMKYAIQEGVELKRLKNDKVRQTYMCGADGCGWRAHGSCMIDGATFMLKTLSDQHDCHMVIETKRLRLSGLLLSLRSWLRAILVSM